MSHFIIVADDLTGATDTAARCFGSGLPAKVYLSPPQKPLEVGVSAVTSDSRHLPAPEAALAVGELVSALKAPPGAIWYKKIDSTLRGNLGSELDALLQGLATQATTSMEADSCAIVCPAFPAQGRGLLHGKLVLQTSEMPEISLAARLAEQTKRPQQAVALAQVRNGVTHLAHALREAVKDGVQLLTVDALTDADLAQIVAAAQQALSKVLYCGSAGLAGALAVHLQEESLRATAPASQRRQHEASGATLVVVGSGNPVAQEQLRRLKQLVQVQALECHPSTTGSAKWERRAGSLATVLHLPPPTAATELDGAVARNYAQMVGEQAATLWKESWPERLLVTGGDTAMAVLSGVGIQELTIVEEVMPGIARSEAQDGWGRQVEVILKPGGFGDAETLIQLLGVD